MGPLLVKDPVLLKRAVVVNVGGVGGETARSLSHTLRILQIFCEAITRWMCIKCVVYLCNVRKYPFVLSIISVDTQMNRAYSYDFEDPGTHISRLNVNEV